MKIGGRGKLYQITAAGYIVHENRALLVKHRKLNMWLPSGGHVLQDRNGFFLESPEETVLRETKEETGLDIEIVGKRFDKFSDKKRKMLTLPENLHLHEIDSEHDHLNLDYFCKVKGSVKHKGTEYYRWFSAEEIDAYPYDSKIEMPDHVRFTAKMAINKLKSG